MSKGDEAKEKILVAATELFCGHGFAGTSMRDVANAAGVKKASVFYYFGNKDDLFAAVLNGYYEAHRSALQAAFDAEASDFAERLHHTIDAYLEFMAANIHYGRLVQGLVSRRERVDFVQESLLPMVAWMEEALAESLPEEGPLAARQFFVTLSGAVINYFTYGEVLRGAWRHDPMSHEGIEERRAHLHWLVDAMWAAIQKT